VVTEAALPLLTEPTGGVPDLIDTQDVLDAAVERLGSVDGPVAVDAERASGYRYGSRAYLVQVRRGELPPMLVDPVVGLDLSGLASVLDGPEWVLHAASQDLSCLAEIGLRPRTLFDTELGGRIAGLPRVGLAAVTESLLGVRLAKEHSAVDWSTRPMPESWRRYAALDVELLVAVRDALAGLLKEQGKLDWAHEEFAALVAAGPPPPRVDPWRRITGLHTLKDRRSVAAARSLWYARDAIARKRDIAQGRILPDTAIVAAAARMPRTAEELASLPVFSGPANRRLAATWLAAIDEARRLPDEALPGPPPSSDGPPPPRVWADRDPEAAARLARVRPVLVEIADHHGMPVENLLTPDTARRLAWRPPDPATPAAVADFLMSHGARRWQAEVTSPSLAVALAGDDHPSGTEPTVTSE
jgi:ribonuclease D